MDAAMLFDYTTMRQCVVIRRRRWQIFTTGGCIAVSHQQIRHFSHCHNRSIKTLIDEAFVSQLIKLIKKMSNIGGKPPIFSPRTQRYYYITFICRHLLKNTYISETIWGSFSCSLLNSRSQCGYQDYQVMTKTRVYQDWGPSLYRVDWLLSYYRYIGICLNIPQYRPILSFSVLQNMMHKNMFGVTDAFQ